MERTSREVQLTDESATAALGAELARLLPPGGVVFLRGPLGAGKTTLVRGLLRALGHRGPVRSPTYTLVESYEIGERRVHHFDLYRLADPEELEYVGLRDYLDAEALCLIEWPERGLGVLPEADFSVELWAENRGRRARLSAGSAEGERALADIKIK